MHDAYTDWYSNEYIPKTRYELLEKYKTKVQSE